MISQSKLRKIKRVLEDSVANLKKNRDLGFAALEASSDDTLELIGNQSAILSDFMRHFRNEKMCSSDDDFPFDEEQSNILMLEWLEYCLETIKNHIKVK